MSGPDQYLRLPVPGPSARGGWSNRRRYDVDSTAIDHTEGGIPFFTRPGLLPTEHTATLHTQGRPNTWFNHNCLDLRKRL